VGRAAARINRFLLSLLDDYFSIAKLKLGGFSHIYGYWSPGPTIVIQEDALGQCSPTVYRDLFIGCSAEVVRYLRDCVFFHLHSTGMRHWREVLSIEGLAGLQLTVEANGPPLSDLVPVLQEILERSRLILFLDNGFRQLAEVLRRVPSEGLYLILREDRFRNDGEYRRFIKTHWNCT
jgi:hypothetical protein